MPWSRSSGTSRTDTSGRASRWLVATEAPALDGRFGYDPEAGMFCAYGKDRAALGTLGELLDAVATDADRMRSLLAAAVKAGVDLDD